MGGGKIWIRLKTELNLRIRKPFFSYFDAAGGRCHINKVTSISSSACP